MDKKTLKRIYKLRYEVHDYNKIKPVLAERYGIYIIRTALKSNIDLLKKEIYDAPLGMSRKYDRLYKKNVQRL